MRRLLIQALAVLMVLMAGQVAAQPATPAQPMRVSPPVVPVPRAPELKPADTARVQAAVQQLGLPCEISAARTVFVRKDTKTTYAEVACGPGRMGYLLQLPKSGAPEAFTCVEANSPVDGKPAPTLCILSSAAETRGLLGQVLKDPTCDVADARGIGRTATGGYFEVACKDGRGFILQTPMPFDAGKPATTIQSCILYDQGSSNITCELGDPAVRLQIVVDPLGAKAGCTPTERRFAGVSRNDGRYYFEAACADGRITFLSGSLDGVFGEALTCETAAPRFGVCRFTAAYKAQAAAYSAQAKKAGDTCEVAAFQAFPARPEGQFVELVCRDGGGRVATFSSDGHGDTVVNCGLAPIVGFKCTLSRQDKANAAVTAELRRVAPATTCSVSQTGLLGVTAAGSIYMEVACADREPGYVVEFQRAPTPTALKALGCRLAGQCRLKDNAPT